MINILKRNHILVEFGILLTLLVSFFAYVAFQNEMLTSIDLSKVKTNSLITYSIDSISMDERDDVEIIGSAYDLSNIETFNNYITGEGQNLFVNITVYLEDTHGKTYELNTTPRYNDALGSYGDINLRFYGFMAKVKKATLDPSEKYTLGILSTSLDGIQTKVLTDMEINHE